MKKYKAPTIIVRGRLHPPPESDPSYKGWKIRADEVVRVMPKSVGIPVLINHDWSKPKVGKVWDVYRHKEDNSLIVDLAIDSTNDGWNALERVINLDLADLSLGFDALGDKKTGERVGDYMPREISLVNKGAMDHAHVMAIQIDDLKVVHTKNNVPVYTVPQLHTVQNSMSTENQAVAAPASAPTDADFMTKYSPDELARLVKLAEETESRKIAELRRVLEESFIPAWNESVKAHPESADPRLGPSVDRIMAMEEGRIVMSAAASAVGNYRQLEAKYLAEKDAREKAESELKARKESEVVLKAPEERNAALFMGLGDKFAASVTNSAGGETADSNKRPRFSDLFTPEALRMNSDRIRNDLASGKIERPLYITRPSAI